MTWLISNAMMQDFENSLSSQEPVEEFLEAICSAGEPSAPLNGNPTPQAYCAPDKMTAFSRLSRYGMTFAPLTDDRGADLLTWYLAGFPARTSASQELAKASTVSAAGSGEKWPASLAKYDPASHSLRTAQHSLLEDSTASSVTLPRSGSMRSGECYQRPTLARNMSGKGSGLWRTPTVSMVNADRATDPEYGQRKLAKGQTITLADQVKDHRMWPTPIVCGNYNRNGSSKTSGDGLATAVAKAMWPTPQASDNRDRGNLSTPAIARRVEKGKQVMLSMAVSSENGRLNPQWVEWLMGWPLGHTDLRPLETAKFREWQQQHSISFASEQDGDA